MAGLSRSSSLGNASASSLIKGATTLRNQINTFNDTQARLVYENSAKTDGDLATYLSYLKGRIDSLTSTGSISDATKAMEMQQTMVTATHSNMSANIQRENIDIMAGNATPQDKLNLIQTQYKTALSIGDAGLAQQLESQAYSLSQTIQLQAQQAADASSTLAKANAGNQESVATTLTHGLDQLNADIKNGGQRNFNDVVQKWVQANGDTLKTLGVSLKDSPNYFDIVQGVAGAIYNAHMLAYQAALPYDPYQAQSYLDAATAVTNGSTKLKTIAGDLSIQDVMQAAASPAEYAYDQSSGKLIQTRQTGFSGYDQNGNPIAAYSGTVKQTVFLNPQQTTLMHKLGLNFTETTSGKDAGTTGNGVQVQATDQTPQWLKSVLGGNGVTNMYSVDGNLQFEADSSSGAGKAYYTIGIDSRGLMGLFQNLANGQAQALGGEYGFNAGYVQQMLNTSQLQIAQAKSAALKLEQTQALQLPKISVAPPAPQPQISTVQPQPTFKSVTQPTYNPQGNNANPQGGAKTPVQSSVSPQGGGGFNLNQSGGGGIRLI